MAAYRRVYDSRHLQADCQEPGSAQERWMINATMHGPIGSDVARCGAMGKLVIPNNYDPMSDADAPPSSHKARIDHPRQQAPNRKYNQPSGRKQYKLILCG